MWVDQAQISPGQRVARGFQALLLLLDGLQRVRAAGFGMLALEPYSLSQQISKLFERPILAERVAGRVVLET